MLDKQSIQAIRDQVAPHEPPVLSLYLNVNPAEAGNRQKASLLRARAALEELAMPEELRAEVLRRLEQEHVIPEGRSLVLFAGADPEELFSVQHLASELPLLDLDSSSGALARWGEPFVSPLLFAADQAERYAAIYVSQELVRAFEVFLGDIREVLALERDLDTQEWRPALEASASPGVGRYTAARGGRDVDSHADRVEVATGRFYSQAVERCEETVLATGAERIILLGTPDALAAFSEALPDQLNQKVVARLPAPADDGMAAADWLPLLEDAVAEAESSFELQLLDEVREKGSWGLSEVLGLLNNHQVDVLVLPWKLGQQVWLAQESGDVATERETLEMLRPDDTYVQLKLKDALPVLVERGNLRLEFVRGQSEERLMDEFAGIAALRRW